MIYRGRTPEQIGEALMAEAERDTGLSDFGQTTFREGLNVFLSSIERDMKLTEAGTKAIHATVLRRLTNRLQIEEHFRIHPETASLPIEEGPVSIIGLPRTGTTALANILSLDDGFRGLRVWEQAKPCPPPLLEDEENDPRRLEMVRRIERMAREEPGQMAVHLWDADATVEDVEVLGLEFRSQQLALPIYGYHAWWRDGDMTAAYAYHRRVAQLLQSRRPPYRWLYKAPYHKFHLEAFVAAYPDARFIMTHRDPAKSIPSALSMTSAMFPPGALPEGDLHRLGQLYSEHLRIGLERAIAARARIGEHRFLDIHHQDFVQDPFGTIDRVYHFLGLELRAQTRRKMMQWHAANSSGAHGSHHYTAAEFGLSEQQLRAEFDFYMRRFDVPIGR